MNKESNKKQTEVKVKHWADITAERIISQKGNKDTYVLASGITPSGVVHFGNFREVITVDLVARALRELGKKVRFIFSWDDYDTFRKIPKNMPKQDDLTKFLFQPIVDTPDPFEKEKSYAAHHEKSFESQLVKVGVQVEPIYQANNYRAGIYKNNIKNALEKTEDIKSILNEHRTTPLKNDWLPVSIYCQNCNTDNKITNTSWDGEAISYLCENCNNQSKEVLEGSTRVKLPWRIDWPMRWSYEKVDFEPGGKDHSSQGGSFTTAKEIVKLYNWEAPIYLQYDFVSIKGAGGKMSSSSGNLITVNDVLKIYEPEIVRWIFASYKTNVDFSISFDLDVIKTYEDFDRQERLAYGVDQGNAKKAAMAKRVYHLSQIEDAPSEMPFQPSFRHLTNILQINDLDISKARSFYSEQIKNDRDERRFTERASCAIYWLKNYAPEEFKFSLNHEAISLELNSKQVSFFKNIRSTIDTQFDSFQTDKELHESMYQIINELELTPAEAFLPFYKILINKEKGPKLAGFLRTVGKDKVLNLLSNF